MLRGVIRAYIRTWNYSVADDAPLTTEDFLHEGFPDLARLWDLADRIEAVLPPENVAGLEAGA